MPKAKQTNETPAKTTATKAKTSKAASADKPAPKKAAAKAKPTPAVISLPFRAGQNDSDTVSMPSGQTLKKKEVLMLKGMLHLENNGRSSGTGETAVSMAQRLLVSKKKGADLMTQLVDFIIANKVIVMQK